MIHRIGWAQCQSNQYKFIPTTLVGCSALQIKLSQNMYALVGPCLFAPHWHVIICRNGLAPCHSNLYIMLTLNMSLCNDWALWPECFFFITLCAEVAWVLSAMPIQCILQTYFSNITDISMYMHCLTQYAHAVTCLCENCLLVSVDRASNLAVSIPFARHRACLVWCLQHSRHGWSPCWCMSWAQCHM